MASSAAARNILKTEDGMKAWKALSDFPSVRVSASQLQDFIWLTRNNNLGLDANKLEALMKSKTSTGSLPWEHPENILEAVKRSSNANIPGTRVEIKKFPSPEDGSENYVLNNAKQYQLEASGDSYLSFQVTNGSFTASFDNIDNAGRLIDRKWGHKRYF